MSHTFHSALRTKEVPQAPRQESQPLQRGEVVYLGYRPDLNACVYAVCDAQARAPYTVGTLIAKALDGEEVKKEESAAARTAQTAASSK